ncbi:DUF6415 family natural product biosynthesis protein [Streptomyces celluloflavus]|uniref:DUF6415 family natural product biosynthesis protein n=1 Tax=Streptomyces celluloflavus TaxID=58344 RepID=A0ABW7RKS6_9ACTN
MSSARETHRPTGPRADTPAANPAAIRNTIDRAHGLLAVSLTMDALAALEKLPRGHIVVLLPYARAAGGCLRTRHDAHRLYTARIDTIERQAEHGLGAGALSAHVQVMELARGCDWLLEQYQEISRDA